MKPLSEIRANASAQDPEVRRDLARIITNARTGSEGLRTLKTQLQIANYKRVMKSAEAPDTVSDQMAPHLYMAAKRLVKEHFLREGKEDLHKYDDLLNRLGSHLDQDVHLVGGPVRDTLMGRKTKDTDVVTIGGHQKIRDRGWNPIKKDFPVFTHKDFPGVELALGRGEKKTGEGHGGFDWSEAPNLPHDLQRRDFTINAMAYHPKTGVVDPFGGRRDIENKTLRHTSDAFSEDPLRTFRAGRFASQLDFDVAPETIHQITKTNAELGKLPKERVRDEVKKAMNTSNPRRFFDTLRASKSLSHWFPEVEKTIDVPAGPPKHHPEGDVYNHSMHAIQYAAAKGYGQKARELALVHDLGKAETPKEELPMHHGHETRTEPAVNLAKRLELGRGTEAEWSQHTKHHMLPYHKHLRQGTVVDYHNAVKRFEEPHLQAVDADYHGRGVERPEFERLNKIKNAFTAIKGVKIEPGTHVQKIKQLQGDAAKKAMGEALDSRLQKELDNLIKGAGGHKDLEYAAKIAKHQGSFGDNDSAQLAPHIAAAAAKAKTKQFLVPAKTKPTMVSPSRRVVKSQTEGENKESLDPKLDEKITVNVGGFGNSVPGMPTTWFPSLVKYNKQIQAARLIRREKGIKNPDALIAKIGIPDKITDLAGYKGVEPETEPKIILRPSVGLPANLRNEKTKQTILAHELGHSTDAAVHEPSKTPYVGGKNIVAAEIRANRNATALGKHFGVELDRDHLTKIITHSLAAMKEDSSSGGTEGWTSTSAGVEMQAGPSEKQKVKGGVKKLKPVTYSSRTGNG